MRLYGSRYVYWFLVTAIHDWQQRGEGPIDGGSHFIGPPAQQAG